MKIRVLIGRRSMWTKGRTDRHTDIMIITVDVRNYAIFNGGHPVTFQYRGICIDVYNTTKVVKIANYILVNAWRHVSAVFIAIFRPTCSTGQVQILRVHYTTAAAYTITGGLARTTQSSKIPPKIKTGAFDNFWGPLHPPFSARHGLSTLNLSPYTCFDFFLYCLLHEVSGSKGLTAGSKVLVLLK
jgi:hypothetical protein